MRRLTFYIIAAALAFSASCSKQEAETAPAQKEKEYETILYATFDEVASKTHLEDMEGRKNVPCWDKGDKIWVSDGTSVGMAEVIELTSKTSAKLGLSTKFSGNTFYAVYPYRLSEGYTEESPESAEKYPYSVNPNGTINIDIPTAQDGTFAKANISAAVCGAGETLKFRNVTSLFKITSKLPSVTTIKCSHANIAGNVTFTYGETSSAVTTGNANAITVTPTGSAPYYIAVAPGITYAAGDVFATYNDKYSKKGKNSTTLARSKIYNLGFAGPEGGTPGEFTIDEDGHKVCFAKGNLYCKRSSPGGTDWTWQFYDNQYDYHEKVLNISLTNKGRSIGNANNELQIDKFCWNSVSMNPINTTAGSKSEENNWGKKIDGSIWTTLSYYEYLYLVKNKRRKDGATWDDMIDGTKRTQARFAKGEVCDVNGLLLFPDGIDYSTDWKHTTIISGVTIERINEYVTGYNKFTESEWKKLEEAGLVFLPLAGVRQGATTISNVNDRGYYWTSSHINDGFPATLYFDNNSTLNINKGDYPAHYAESVRLVHKL